MWIPAQVRYSIPAKSSLSVESFLTLRIDKLACVQYMYNALLDIKNERVFTRIFEHIPIPIVQVRTLSLVRVGAGIGGWWKSGCGKKVRNQIRNAAYDEEKIRLSDWGTEKLTIIARSWGLTNLLKNIRSTTVLLRNRRIDNPVTTGDLTRYHNPTEGKFW